MWKTLAKLPRHEHNHAFLVRHFGQTEIIKSLFDSTTVLDDNLHCENGCCCGRRICEMPNGKLLAVCNDDSSNCPELVISNNDRRIFSLNLKKIAALVAELTQNISVFKDVQTIDGTSSCIRVGHYIPRGTIRYPVFFGVDIHDGDLESIINHVIGLDGSAILMMPSIDNISQSKINAIRAKGSALISLQDLTNTDTLIDTAKALEAFSAFHEDQEDPMPEVSCVLFPTPADSEWSNITIKFTDGHTVRVTCNTGNNRVSQVYNFTQMGMADGRTASPNKQWNLLEGFADERGQFTWDNPKANRNQKKQKQELKKVFQKFFGIYDSDPFEDYKDHKNRVCYRSKFHISPDE